MQLDKPSVRKALAAATCTLLATSLQIESVQAKDKKWEVNATGFFYTEPDRISVYEEILYLKKEIGDNEFLSIKRTHDILTGASPTGEAEPVSTATFTSPSGSKLVTNAGDTPLGEFQDIRTAYNFSWNKPLTRFLSGSFSANYSYEYDYMSIGMSSLFAKDLEGRKTTLNLGLSGSFDRIKPLGGIPTGGNSTSDTTRYRWDQKLVLDYLLGVTRVLNRRALATLTYMRGLAGGYLTDPYKIFSILKSDGVTPDGATHFENRPESRSTSSVHLRVLRNRSDKKRRGDVIDSNYRYFWDDWGIISHTAELRYRMAVKNKKGKLSPNDEHYTGHLRLYRQSAADFYTYGIPVGQVIPDFVSSDYRLANMATATLGLGWGRDIYKDVKIKLRGEYLYQWYLNSELNPLSALSAQASLYYDF